MDNTFTYYRNHEISSELISPICLYKWETQSAESNPSRDHSQKQNSHLQVPSHCSSHSVLLFPHVVLKTGLMRVKQNDPLGISFPVLNWKAFPHTHTSSTLSVCNHNEFPNQKACLLMMVKLLMQRKNKCSQILDRSGDSIGLIISSCIKHLYRPVLQHLKLNTLKSKLTSNQKPLPVSPPHLPAPNPTASSPHISPGAKSWSHFSLFLWQSFLGSSWK